MERQDRIQAYLDEHMSAAERLAFEAEMQKDPGLAEETALQKDAIALLKLDRQRAYKTQLQTIAQKGQSTPVVALHQRRWFQIAATILVLIGVGWLFREAFSGPVNYQEIAQAYHQPYPNRLNVRGDSQTSVEQGLTAYDQQDYAEAIDLLNSVDEGDSLYTAAQFYLGNAYLSHQQGAEAVVVFEALQTRADNAFAEATKWYLALAYLASEQTEPGKALLEEIAGDADHSYRSKAQEILQ
jgi:hypothetical protein